MNRTRLLFLVALLAVAAFAVLPAMAEDEENKAAGPVGRWELRLNSGSDQIFLIDTVTGQVYQAKENPRTSTEWALLPPPLK